MTMYKIVCKETGMEGMKYYNTYEEAAEAAELRTNLSRYHWIVKMVILR